MNFPGQSQSAVVNNPQVNSKFCQPLIDGYTDRVAASTTPGCFTGACLTNTTVTVSVTYGNTQMFQLIMEMPLFNETTLGTTVYCAPTTAPCGLPLQGFYNFIFIIAIILAGGGFLVALANKQLSGDERQNVVLDFVIAVLFETPVPCHLQQHRPPYQLPRHDDSSGAQPALHGLRPADRPGLGSSSPGPREGASGVCSFRR